MIPMHAPERCEGIDCPFHNPSLHHMRTWATTVRYDRYGLTERLCPRHKIGHPDPDSVAWLIKHYDDGTLFDLGILDRPDEDASAEGNYSVFTLHGCCGCCSPDGDWQR